MRREVDAQATTWITESVRSEYEDAGLWTDATWMDRFVLQAVEDPAAVAVVDELGSMTRGQVLGTARRLAAYLHKEGIRAGDVITLVVPNWREFVVIHAATGLLGCVVNPLLPKVGQPEMRHILRTAQSRFVFVAADHRGTSPWKTASSAAEGIDGILGIVPVRGGENSYEDILAEPWEERYALPDVSVDAKAWDTVTFTSGTESLPKGVVHSHQTTMFGLRSYIDDVLNLNTDDCVFMPSPICHASGIQWGLRTSIHAGVPLILQDRWDPKIALELIDRHRCTYTLAATPFVVDLIAAKSKGEGSGESLRYVASGGAAIPRQLVAEVRSAFGAELMAVFGASETYVTTATRPGSSDPVLATDGAALPGVQVAVVDETGVPVKPGQEGEIVTRGPQVFIGYLGDPDLTHRAFRGEWYRFGDLGRIDDAGMLHVTGRIKDIVIRGGENISVREIEEILMSHSKVEAVAVVGVPDPRLGERCCAVVKPSADQSPTLEELNAFLLERGLAKFKLPERLETVDEIPMTATGKIRKADLRRQIVGNA
ncbi:AMP-binding protein [Rhodococcus globerulus]|uniref:AMP-binding protein n=1 Tax=Rhodococcus globerulus TaxID=33008 RepID=A0ABU4C2Z7_RHOGO|nr:AMP-binding protein [Rhodococcus globerulus]MDV6270861.1 AMP-binding protein [Rhodococcus globerulus]